MISLSALTALVWVATGMTVFAVVLLIALLIRDFKRGVLW
jgi:heme exporter protein D